MICCCGFKPSRKVDVCHAAGQAKYHQELLYLSDHLLAEMLSHVQQLSQQHYTHQCDPACTEGGKGKPQELLAQWRGPRKHVSNYTMCPVDTRRRRGARQARFLTPISLGASGQRCDTGENSRKTQGETGKNKKQQCFESPAASREGRLSTSCVGVADSYVQVQFSSGV